MRYLFGPVNSRRLGISLGVDLLPYKTCSLNCVYCECGRTTELTAERRVWVPTAAVIDELAAYLAPAPGLDVITFSGSGEPTLHSGIGEIIGWLKQNHPRYRVAVLTNGTLLEDPAVRRDIARADVVVPSLDAVSETVFERILRPAPGVTAAGVVRGIGALRREYAGTLIVEIFIIPGYNDGDDELRGLADACRAIAPDLVELNRLDRPAAEAWVSRADDGTLERAAALFHPVPVALVGRPGTRGLHEQGRTDLAGAVVATLRRRPSTADDLALALGRPPADVLTVLEGLVSSGRVIVETGGRGTFYRLLTPGE